MSKRRRAWPYDYGGGSGPLGIFGRQNVALWLRSDLGVTLNGSNVSAWADQSGNSQNALQATGASQPAYTSSGGLAGRPYLSGASGKSLASAVTLPVGNPYEIFFVASFGGGSGGMFDSTTVGYPALTTVANNLTQKLSSSNVNPTALGSTNAGFLCDAISILRALSFTPTARRPTAQARRAALRRMRGLDTSF